MSIVIFVPNGMMHFVGMKVRVAFLFLLSAAIAGCGDDDDNQGSVCTQLVQAECDNRVRCGNITQEQVPQCVTENEANIGGFGISCAQVTGPGPGFDNCQQTLSTNQCVDQNTFMAACNPATVFAVETQNPGQPGGTTPGGTPGGLTTPGGSCEALLTAVCNDDVECGSITSDQVPQCRETYRQSDACGIVSNFSECIQALNVSGCISDDALRQACS